MDIKAKLKELGLSADNSVVMGSGILDALGIRPSNDLDVLVREDDWYRLHETGDFDTVHIHGQDVLRSGDVESGKGWNVLGKTWRVGDFEEESEVIDGARYISIEFLLRAKKDWVANGVEREKDRRDIELMEAYLAKSGNLGSSHQPD